MHSPHRIAQFDLQRAYRELVRRSPADQLVKEQLDAKVAPVWAHYNKQDDKELHARWLDAVCAPLLSCRY